VSSEFSIPAVPVSLEEDCRIAVVRMRAELLSLYHSVAADPDKPQAVSRQFGVNRNLAWQLSRVMREDNPMQALSLIPKPGAVAIMVDLFRKAGADEAILQRVAVAFSDFEAMVARQIGDRAELELMLDARGIGPHGPLDLSRKLLFKGAAGLLGARADAHLASLFIAPSTGNPDRIDVAWVAGWCGVTRLRGGTPLPGLRLGSPVASADLLTIDADPSGLVREFSVGPVPDCRVFRRQHDLLCSPGAGISGKSGAFSCAFGFIQRGVSTLDDEAFIQTISKVDLSLPVQTLQFDLFIHPSVNLEVAPRGSILFQTSPGHDASDDAGRLPLPVKLVDLGIGGRPGSRLIGRYDDLIGRVFARAGWDGAAFRCRRLSLDFPPIGSVVSVKLTRGPKPA
jgi:hypothetical protein